ncbi:hypothetical protein MHPYR_440053 [uncultured Mycobacterium sp.]|uniref:Uncharacterized protein n=1 Tax=uncultured Mycobacterium sp. TaxID=171292 RepID=A0A1Y5PN18_9MYCO|nr:hypothetical protein MHPYR_440053 [uncultured Mycobacterium sp.]
MNEPTRTDSDSIDSVASTVSSWEVPVSELDLIVDVLSAKFPGHTRAHVRDVVYETHRRLYAAARVRAHLIPLTLNLARSELDSRSPGPVSSRP